MGTCSSQPETLPCSSSRRVLSGTCRQCCRRPRDALVNSVGRPARSAGSCALLPPALSDSSLVAASVGHGLAAFGTADFSGPQRIKPFVFWKKKLLWSGGALWNGVRYEAFLHEGAWGAFPWGCGAATQPVGMTLTAPCAWGGLGHKQPPGTVCPAGGTLNLNLKKRDQTQSHRLASNFSRRCIRETVLD